MIAGALQELSFRWCKREPVESDTHNSWNVNILHNLLDEKYVIDRCHMAAKFDMFFEEKQYIIPVA